MGSGRALLSGCHGAHAQPADTSRAGVRRRSRSRRRAPCEQELAARRIGVDGAADDIPNRRHLLPFVDEQGASTTEDDLGISRYRLTDGLRAQLRKTRNSQLSRRDLANALRPVGRDRRYLPEELIEVGAHDAAKLRHLRSIQNADFELNTSHTVN